jgi:hypothetical protein
MAQCISDSATDHSSAYEIVDRRMARHAASRSPVPKQMSYALLLARGVSILLIVVALIIGANALLVPLLDQFV